ncbi:GNAT family N-acetyltransferase/peptidase C39 family protein [Marinobacter qingdaonensis]|uniref:GNAT family N-acetyltransferase/peptidase C39 family protein n=1 Tax=Marinobacter qingdaonensis TaxID=3108486 RepID=A0ABU5P2R2_9GAMM|nr:GNAT family N-acetyltransferase/peptidase C39 family protein [Marinobacter sp. ASW11-75]MEA1082330.1 GNAT family N-acetyltransferase/peptidase C39 family protein [Marinobacter sp. ASW11-75]MEE2763964.1 GNAT family N-acetyltransferase/peptidase C39 family protein [Pseudomonadota bacterium]MEE3119124.1 GNAT family N-acetyltransferase/peptidase C39 family protein [Pseudomonadota bacterium]
MSEPQLQLRQAVSSDLDSLVRLENLCFSDDRISRRSFRRFLDMPRDRIIVATLGDELVGYCLMLMHAATRLARIYSIAVSPKARGQGAGEKLVRAAERAAVEAGRIVMRLEVREDNGAAIGLYRRLGYRQFGTYRDYYEDHGDALRFERRILFYEPSRQFPVVPYYPQTTEFSCGPAALIMAMAALDEQQPVTTLEELKLWREATTIFMLAGHGGCGPHGLALAAWNRGFHASAWISKEGALFKDTVRNDDKKRVLELVHEGFLHDIGKTSIELRHDPLTLAGMEQALHDGRVPVILISTWQLNRSRVPHWVTVCAIDDQFVYLHDPEIDVDAGESVADKQYLPIERRIFDRMSRYGSVQPLQAAVIVGPKRDG